VRGRGGDESGDFSPLPPLSPSPRLSAVDQRMLPRVQVPAWQGIGGLVHGFLGRHGGVSAGDCASLNLSASVEDASTALESNWDRVRREFPGIVMVTMRQVHGAQVVRVDQATTEIGPADGLITRACGVGLGVLTADCVPILMIAPRERIALAVHAGWRGTLAGIAHAAVGAAQHEFGIRATWRRWGRPSGGAVTRSRRISGQNWRTAGAGCPRPGGAMATAGRWICARRIWPSSPPQASLQARSLRSVHARPAVPGSTSRTEAPEGEPDASSASSGGSKIDVVTVLFAW